MKTKNTPLCFSDVHGSGILLSENNMVATRNTEHFCSGITFSSKSLIIDTKVCLELGHISDWSGAIRIGVTTYDPLKLTLETLPRYACPDLTNKDGYWARAISEKYAETGNRVTFYVNSKGQMHYFINNEHKGLLLSHLPTNAPLWFLFDLYGNTVTAKFVQPEEAPVEIVARGPDAMRAYHQSCESGTQPAFRTRLMFVGKDRVGKTSLKKSLTGQRHNKSELSTDGIDLSASCSFNMRDRKAWKLAIKGEDLDKKENTLGILGSIEGLEEEYHQALASNIVQELLYRQRLKEKEKADDDVTKKQEETKPKPKKTKQELKTQESLQALEELTTDNELIHEMPERVVQLVEQKLKEHGKDADSRTNGDETQSGQNIMLNIWDFAGQALYYTTHQVFLTCRAVYVIVFNLCHDLDEQTRIQIGPTDEKDCRESELSNLDYMDYWMNSIHAHTAQNTRNSVDNMTLSPPIFIVGTHRNSLASDPDILDQMVEEKFARIRQYLVGKPYQRHIINKFYAIENSIQNGEDEQIKDFRRHVEEVASKQPYMGEQMPIKWLKLEQAVAKLVDSGVNFVSFDQIREVAKEEGVVTDEELKTTLEFYHDLGIMIYYGNSGTLDNVLQNTVILQPKWLVDMFKRLITVKQLDQQSFTYMDSWNRLDKEGILDERLISHLWSDIQNEKPALLGLMEKFDLICCRLPPNSLSSSSGYSKKSYYVPCRLKHCASPESVYTSKPLDVVFYLDFYGFLPEGLFHRILTRAVRWSQENGGSEPQLFYHLARFFLDNEHDFVLEMSAFKEAKIKVKVLRVAVLGDLDNFDTQSLQSAEKLAQTPPDPSACAKVRNFIDSTLSDLREMWVRRISYRICVECVCDKKSTNGSHFLNLDECLANKIVLCDHRRVKTALYRSWFPAPLIKIKEGPIFSDTLIEQVAQENTPNIERTAADMPSWTKSAAKLLNGGSEGQDWTALGKKLGYKKNKIDKFGEDLNPGLALIADWIISSGNTALSVDMIISCLEQMHRDDIIEIIQNGQESEVDPPQIFFSYQWDSQDEVRETRDKMERAGFSCWMDIGQMGGGDQLYNRIDEGIRKAKVILACITPKYVVSHHCHQELSLADLLRKPIIPIMYEKVQWPPPGGMSLMFSQLIYINMKGVGGHGGSGIHADLEDRYNEIIQQISRHATPSLGKIREHSLKTSQKQTASETSLNDSSSNYTTTPEPPGYPDFMMLQQLQPTLQNSPPTEAQNTAPPVTMQRRTNQVEQVHVTKCGVCTIL